MPIELSYKIKTRGGCDVSHRAGRETHLTHCLGPMALDVRRLRSGDTFLGGVNFGTDAGFPEATERNRLWVQR